MVEEQLSGDVDRQNAANAVAVETATSTVERKVSSKLRRIDSLNLEAGSLHASNNKMDWNRTLSLAFLSIGVIYGDLGTSPLYVYASTFTDGIQHKDDSVGVLSLIIYTLILFPMVKYVFIVLWANDNGDGGTFALYSLICRSANIGLIPKDQPEDRDLSNYRLDTPSNQFCRAMKIKDKLEKSMTAKIALFLCSILGTSMLIGDGVLTPCISVLSAVGGIGLHGDSVVYISIAILVVLFSIQRFGTDKVGYMFAPAICLWFLFISGIGVYNLFHHDITVLKAFNPMYIIEYCRRNGKQGWVSLGGVILCITGTEAMFADLGHFSVLAVQISFSTLVFPALIMAYAGQAAYLSKFPDHVGNTFYDSIPSPLYWPTFIVANAAAIIASQALISGAFAIISQSVCLSCFPRVKVVHTSAKYEGQVYIPEVNYFLMVACVIVTYGFKTTEKLGNAYGIAVVAVMLITTFLVTLIMLMIWQTKIWWISLFFGVFMSIELVFFSALLYKFIQGGYLPLTVSFVLMTIMGTWHYAQRERYMFELKNKVSSSYVRSLADNPDINRIPGIGLVYSELVQGIPPIFPHFISNVPSIYSVTVFVSIKSIPISKVALEERFLFRQVEPKEFKIFRCVVRYGYMDTIEEPGEFERFLVDNLVEFLRDEQLFHEGSSVQEHVNEGENIPHSGVLINRMARRSSVSAAHMDDSFGSINSTDSSNRITPVLVVRGAEDEIEFVKRAKDRGVFYLIGEAEVVAMKDSSFLKKFAINNVYSFLRKNSRQGEKALAIPRTRLLRVGMIYEV